MKKVMRHGMEMTEVRPGVYVHTSDSGVDYKEWNVCEIIKGRRLELKMTQQDLADKLGVNISTISRYEAGKIEYVTYERLMQFANALDCTMDYLEAKTDDPHENIEESFRSKQEEDLLSMFRQLPPEQRAAILTMLKGMVK